MQVGSLCNQKIICARKDETVLTAARRMRDQHVGSLVVVEGDGDCRVPIGILTDRDIVVSAVAGLDGDAAPLAKVLVGDIMTSRPVVAVAEDEITEVIRAMRRHRIRRVPIVDAGGCLIGIASYDDIIEHLAEQLGSLAQTVSWQPRTERPHRP